MIEVCNWQSAVAKSTSIKGVIFDLDGTLIDTQPIIYASYRHAVKTVLGYVPSDESIRRTLGKTLRQGLALFSEDHLDQLVKAYRKHNIENHRAYVRPFAGSAEVLSRLRLAGLKVGIATSKRRDVAILGMRISGLLGYPAGMVFEEDSPWHKPYPHPLWVACQRLHLSPTQCIYVGDGIVDMAAAKAAGMVPISVSWSVFSAEELTAAGAAIVAQDWTQFLEILGLGQTLREGFVGTKGNLFTETFPGCGGEGVCAG